MPTQDPNTPRTRAGEGEVIGTSATHQGEGLIGPGIFRDRHVLVCVTGGIAAYKTAVVVSRVVQSGGQVTVAMTEAATKFVGPMTFEALSGRAVLTSPWDAVESRDPQHVALARSVSAAVVAPCSMDCLARLATGRADDIVSLIVSAIDRRRTPVILCPAMNEAMWGQPSTQRNLAQLREDGFTIVGPEEGWQACRTVGVGRMSEPEAILTALCEALRTGVSSRGT